MKSEQSVTSLLRNRLLGELHLGHLRPGQRLPSIREAAADLGADHRAIAQAYRRLAEEELVELRGRSGAYVAPQRRIGGEVMQETARWIAGVLVEARKRRLTVPSFPEFVRRCTAQVAIRCACVESNGDALLALCTEMREDFGLDATAVPADSLQAGPDAVGDADLVVTTRFHEDAVSDIGKPVVVATVATELVGVIERRLRDGPLAVIVDDPAFGERFRMVYGSRAAKPDGIRIVLASDAAAIARLDRAEPVLATRAARRLLPDLDLPLLVPRYPAISADSAREIAEHLVRLNLEADAG